MERPRISLIQQLMTQLIFRDLPGVSTVEHQLDMHFRDRLLDDEIEELPHLIDDISLGLFGITTRDTLYWAVPEIVRSKYSQVDWEAQFDVLWAYSRDPNTAWKAFDLDVRCEDGRPLHCLEVFGRQLICALNGLHPHAVILFSNAATSKAA